MEWFLLGGLLVVVIIIWCVTTNSRKARIGEHVRGLGGEVLVVELCFLSRGPFIFVGKGQQVFRFEYMMDGKHKEGWVKFGGWTGTDWRM